MSAKSIQILKLSVHSKTENHNHFNVDVSCCVSSTWTIYVQRYTFVRKLTRAKKPVNRNIYNMCSRLVQGNRCSLCDHQSYIFIYVWKKINFTGQVLRIVCHPIAQWNRFQPLNWKNVKCFLSQSPKIKLRNMNWNIRWHLGSMYLHYTNGRNGEQNNSNCRVSCQIWKLWNWNFFYSFKKTDIFRRNFLFI